MRTLLRAFGCLSGIALLVSCNTKNGGGITGDTDSVVNKFRMDERHPGKMVLLNSSVYDRKTRKLKEEIMRNGPADSMVSRFYFNYSAALLDSVRKRNDMVRYVLRKGATELIYFNGKLTSENQYDRHNNQVRSVWYMDDQGRGLEDEHRYTYNTANKKTGDKYFSEGKLIYEAIYTYNKAGKLINEDYVSATVRPGSNVVPPDWVQYEYGNDGKLLRKIVVTDRLVKKPYKKSEKDLYNKVDIIAYDYDLKGRLQREWVYLPVTSADKSEPVQALAGKVDKVGDRFTYNYFLLARSGKRTD